MRGDFSPPGTAVRQSGAFSRQQAMAGGYSEYQVRRLLRSGQWVVVLGSVLAVAGTPVLGVTLLWAASLTAGVGAVASHATAAQFWGLKVPREAEVHVIVDVDRRVRVSGLRTHRVPLPPEDLVVVSGVAVTTKLRTVVDCLLWLAEEDGRSMLTDAVRRKIVTVREVREYIYGGPLRHGIGRALSVLKDVSDGTWSEAEVRLRRLLERAGVTGFLMNEPILDRHGIQIGFADVLFPRARVVIEFDGRAWHVSDRSFQDDRTKQNRLVTEGYVVLRFTWEDLVHRPGEVLRQVRLALAAAA